MSPEREPSDLDVRLARNVGRLVSSSTGEPLSRPAHDASFQLLERQWAGRGRRTRLWGGSLVLGSLIVMGASGYLGGVRLGRLTDAPLTYRVGAGPTLPAGAPLEPAGGAGTAEVAFSDGTRVRLEPRSRGRVVELDRRGGRVALYDGRAHVAVRHRPDSRWLFRAGPFEVEVHGTSFSIAWDAAAARFDLRMESGVVSVRGPIAGGERVLRAGEVLSVRLDQPEEPAGDLAPPLAPPPSPPHPGKRREGAGTATERARPSSEWRSELARGRASAVVADAERRGIGRVLESASSEELAALADAARYVSRQDLARRTFLVQRRRFPRLARAAEAAFLLGRLEDESADGALRALAWYDRYLAEAPAGAYVSEALGRKMMVLERARRREEAAAIASDYLRRFPAGSYAHAAGVLVGRVGSARGAATPRVQ